MVASSSADDQEAKRFIASIEDRIDAHFSDISKSDQAQNAARPPLFPPEALGRSREQPRTPAAGIRTPRQGWSSSRR